MNNQTRFPDPVRTIEQDDLDTFLEKINRLQRCVAGIAHAIDMTDRSRNSGPSNNLLINPSVIAVGLSSILLACASEMQISLEHLQRSFSPVPEHEKKPCPQGLRTEGPCPVTELSATRRNENG
jgi:hypothetical protein